MQNTTAIVPVALSGDPSLNRWERRTIEAINSDADQSAVDEIVAIAERILAERLATDTESRVRTHAQLTYIEIEYFARLAYFRAYPDSYTQVLDTIQDILRDRIRPIYPEHPADIDADGGSRVTRNYYSCQSHCCKNHGCKYGYTGCPVSTGLVVQDHPCEQCTWEISEAAMFAGADYARPGEIAYSAIVGLARTDTADDAKPMANMPTDAQVHTAISEALAGLTINGWALTRIIGSNDDDVDDDD